MWVLTEARKGDLIPCSWKELHVVVRSLIWCWEWNSGSLEEQAVLLPTELLSSRMLFFFVLSGDEFSLCSLG